MGLKPEYRPALIARAGQSPEVLHYVGYDDDAGGIVSVVRALAEEAQFHSVLGLNREARQSRTPALPQAEFAPLAGEKISPLNLWRARRAAREVQAWLRAEPGRIFHGHSRAGLLVALWLHAWGERRVVASVHCYGRHRWFYRWAAQRLGARLWWLSPAMRRYYGVSGEGWGQCLPGGVTRRWFDLAPAAPVPGVLRLGGAGARVRWKRWELVPEALRELGDRAVVFEHIGAEPDGGYAGELRALSGPVVHWRPAETDTARLLRSIDVLVCASDQEPFSMAVQEALAAGVPVLAAAGGGSLDLIRPGVNGWLFESGNASALAARLRDIAETRAWERLDRAAIRASAWRAEEVGVRWKTAYAALA